ncbi:MAG: SOS response-associated peptidase [Burkholderiales bacterium]|nr:SOS response-associated peptidase [Burkholderiales bacterium]
MCGRYNIITDPQALYDAFQVEVELNASPLARYNVAPATDQLVVLEEDGRRAARWHHWGLIPHWAKDMSIGYKTINARGESVAAKPAFRAAFRQRRCLVPASGFYEWKALAGGKQPYLIRMRSGELFAFAGLWESWAGPEGERRSFTIVTTAPNALMERIHDRMPVIIPRAQYARWLDPALRDPAQVQAMIASYPESELEAIPVGRQIGNVRNQGPALIEPAGAPLASGPPG